MNDLLEDEAIDLSSMRFERDLYRPEARHIESGAKTVLILDARGRIQFCSDPSPFASPDSNLSGHSIICLVPTLPLREATPGYNIAYVRFSFSAEPWHRHAVRTASGLLREADISLKPIPLERGYCLLGLIRLRVPLNAEKSSVARMRRSVPERKFSVNMLSD